MLTRSKTLQLRTRMREQTICPISLEAFTKQSKIFAHDGIKFNGLQLQRYLVLVPGSTNPITRRTFTVPDLMDLDALCDNGIKLLKGEVAQRASEILRQEENNLIFFETELKNALHKFLVHHRLQTSYELLLEEVAEIRNDVVRIGPTEWDQMVLRAESFCQGFPCYMLSVKNDIQEILRPNQWPYTPLYSSSDEHSDSDEGEDSENALAGLPPYTPFSTVFSLMRTPPPRRLNF